MSPAPRRAVLVVFAKAPHPGLVKTRMCPPLTPEEAAELYGCMLDDVLEASVGHAKALDLELILAVHPEDALAQLADRAPPPFRVIAQRGGGLAERMDRAIRETCAAGFDRVLLRGSDNPMLSPAHLARTLELLDRHDVVLTPDRDGGYGAVGVRAPAPGLFDHAMSSDRLLEETLQGARARGLDCAIGLDSFDIDSVADLGHFEAWLDAVGEEHACRRTLDWVDGRGLRPIRA